MPAAEIDDAPAPEEPAHAPRDLPRFVELLARETSRLTHRARHAIEQRGAGKSVQVARRQTSARRRLERHCRLPIGDCRLYGLSIGDCRLAIGSGLDAEGDGAGERLSFHSGRFKDLSRRSSRLVSGEIGPSGPSLKHSDLLDDGDGVAASLAGHATHWQVPGQPEGASVMIDPTSPQTSAMLVRMRSRRPSSQMPPLGSVLRDDKAIDVISKWIATDIQRR